MSTEPMKLFSSLKMATAILLAGATVMAAAAIEATTARADDLIVKYDQSQLLRLPRPAAEIIIGNPTIADVSIQGGNLLVITGKTFGITNIIALDAERNVIQDQRVLVQRDEGRVVNLVKGAKRESYNCSPQCNPSITIGDDQKYFTEAMSMSQTKMRFSESGGSGGQGGGEGGGQ
jgi:Flp pilus assembly secretin CpaC